MISLPLAFCCLTLESDLWLIFSQGIIFCFSPPPPPARLFSICVCLLCLTESCPVKTLNAQEAGANPEDSQVVSPVFTVPVKEVQVKNGAPLKRTGGAGRDEWNLVGL